MILFYQTRTRVIGFIISASMDRCMNVTIILTIQKKWIIKTKIIRSIGHYVDDNLTFEIEKRLSRIELCKSDLMKFLETVLECLPSSLNCSGKPEKLDKQK